MLKEAAVNEHPSDETIAAFIDGRLDGRGRQVVVDHLAFCDDCRAVWDTAGDSMDLEQSLPVNVVRGGFGRRVALTGASVAAAAVAAAAYLWPAVIMPAQNLADMKAAAGEAKTRPTVARLTGFPFGATPSPTRGEGKKDMAPHLELATFEAIENSEKHPNARTLHAAGVARVLRGDPDAIEVLQNALRRRTDDLNVLNDLAAAMLDRCGGTLKAADCDAAFAAANDAWSKAHSPEAGWNRALAATFAALDPSRLDAEGNVLPEYRQRAEAAWDDYLKVETVKEWRTEAARRRESLRPLGER